jgi:hypothetical protein
LNNLYGYSGRWHNQIYQNHPYMELERPLLRTAHAGGEALTDHARSRLAILVRICSASRQELRLRFGEKLHQAFPRFFRMTVKLQEFSVMTDRQLNDPWVFRHVSHPQFKHC